MQPLAPCQLSLSGEIKDKLPHASTPPALQELAALIPLPEPFEVSCYLEQILQNAFESRVGEGTTATSTDTDSTLTDMGERRWRLGRNIIDPCPTCHKPVNVEEKTTAMGSHSPPFPSVTSASSALVLSALFGQHPAQSIRVKQGWSGRQPLQCASWGCAVPENAVSGQNPPRNFRQEPDKTKNKRIVSSPFPLPFNSHSFM